MKTKSTTPHRLAAASFIAGLLFVSAASSSPAPPGSPGGSALPDGLSGVESAAAPRLQLAAVLETEAPDLTAPAARDLPPPALADRDGDGLSDALQGRLAAAGPGDLIDVVVRFSGLGDAASAEQVVGRFLVRREFSIIQGFAATMTTAQAAALARTPGVFRVEEDFEVTINLDGARSDFLIDDIHDPLGAFGLTGIGIGICIADTGIDPAHEQTNGGKIAGFFDAVAGLTTAYDDHGHGTHVANIAAGAGDEQPVYAGVAPGADVYAAKVLNFLGSGSESQIIAGIEWCIAQVGVDIISMSLGTAAPSDGQDALSAAVNNAVVIHGKVAVIAAGNTGSAPSTIGSPGAAQDAITVGAGANPSGNGGGPYLGSFSSRGPVLAPGGDLLKPDFVAPGIRIAAAQAGTGNGYTDKSGTSMATPFTAGVVALLLAADLALSPAEIKALLISTALDRGIAGPDNDWGAGWIDPSAAVGAASGLSVAEAMTLPTYSRVEAFVGAGSEWFSDPIVVTAADVAAGMPLAVTVTIEGQVHCAFGDPILCQLLGGWDWDPDLDAELIDDATGARVTANAGDVTLSECMLAGEWCGGSRQETLHFKPVVPGTYRVRVYAFSGQGNFALDQAFGLTGGGSPPPPPPPPPPDDPPTVGLTSPAAGATVSGSVTVTASAGDDNGVVNVEFFIDDLSIGIDTNAADGWSLAWDTTFESDGDHVIKATAIDGIGQTASDSRTVTTSNAPPPDDPPTVGLTSPAAGATVSGSVTVTASAGDDNGVVDVEFFIDNLSIGIDTNAADGWSLAWDTTFESDGNHVVKATASDVVGQTASDSRTVTVSNAPPPPATGSILGTVTDAVSGEPINRADVETDTGLAAKTNKDGTYVITDVPGSFLGAVIASKKGYSPGAVSDVSIGAGGLATVPFALNPESGGGGSGGGGGGGRGGGPKNK